MTRSNPRFHTCIPLKTLLALLLISACARGGQNDANLASDILADVNSIKAIDNHAHPVRPVGQGEPPDREFDALPVDNMEPSSDPLQMRPSDPGLVEAWKALWNYPYDDAKPEHLKEWQEHKQRIVAERAGSGKAVAGLELAALQIEGGEGRRGAFGSHR